MCALDIEVHYSKFQFHKGTIKTLGTGDDATGEHLFQFHKGTIKTNKISDADYQTRNFNSIKVQLKRSIFYYSLRLSRFQFHKGTIKTSVFVKY